MDYSNIVRDLDARISRLQQARNALAGLSNTSTTGGRKQKRHMSKKARAKIAAAQRARWAKVKKTAKRAV